MRKVALAGLLDLHPDRHRPMTAAQDATGVGIE